MVQPLSFLSSFALCTVACVALLPLLKKVKAKQSILHYVAEHSGKNGTPTMGGIAFIVAIIVTACIFCDLSNRGTVVALAVFAGYAVVGFLDDFIKIRFKRNQGLFAYQKILVQLAIAVVVAIFVYRTPLSGTKSAYHSRTGKFCWGVGLCLLWCSFIWHAPTASISPTASTDWQLPLRYAFLWE